jgi:branched-chain amino acid transport system ATP-binding protein
MTSAPALLDVRALHAGYGLTRVLHGIGLQLAEGTITALLGANGAGKTTTLRALCAMVRTEGEIRFRGERIERRTTEDIVRLGIAHVPEGRGTFLHLNTEENLRLGAYVRRDRAAVEQDLERVYAHFPRLKERRRQQAGTLSGGEQQMLAVSRALMLRPKLLLLDEPSFGLAPLVVRELFGILREINRRERVSMLLVEQNAAMALELADHALLLETGRVVLVGSAQEVRRNDAVRAAYLGHEASAVEH